jgi:antitoxin VapB
MGVIVRGKTFRSGNSVAVRLPRELGYDADTIVTIERVGRQLTITPDIDPEEEGRKLDDLIAALHAIGPITPIGVREPIELPDRPGLYE